MLLVCISSFEDSFYASKKKGEIGGGGQALAWGAVHMAATLAGCGMTLVEPFLTLLAQTGIETTPLPNKGTISGTVGSFQSGGAFAGCMESPDH